MKEYSPLSLPPERLQKGAGGVCPWWEREQGLILWPGGLLLACLSLLGAVLKPPHGGLAPHTCTEELS